MRKKIILTGLAAFFIISLGILLPQQSQEDAKFAKALNLYYDDLWKFYPTAATLAGYYKYNDKLEDMSTDNIEKRLEALDVHNQELVAKIAKAKLSADNQIDCDIIIDALEMELFKLENLVPYQYNPIFYNDLLLQSVRSLFLREFAPLDTRVKSATERLKQLPNLIKQAKENLKTPAQIFTEKALQQMPAIIDFYKSELPKLVESAAADGKVKCLAENSKAITALEDYQKFLQNELLPRSTGNFRLGGQAHQRLFRLTCQSNILIDELLSRYKADLNNLRREMAMVAMPFYRIMYPNINMEQLSTQYNEEQLRNIFIKGVFDKIKDNHVEKGELVNRIKSTKEEVKNFLTKTQLIELPAEDLNIEPLASAYQGLDWTVLSGPAPYETTGPFTLFLSPIPDSWTNDQVTSYLEEYNNFFLYYWTIRRVYPGQFVPLYFNHKNPSISRKLYPNMPLVRGWSAYIEDMFVNSGFGEYDLRLRLNQLKYQLRSVIDFMLEIYIHEGDMTKEQAIDQMTKNGFQTQAEAERKWENIILHPGDAAYAYVGFQEILDMEKDYKKLKGDSFSQKEFLTKLLSNGAIPIRTIKAKILQ
jgi:hypothetical protein